MESYDVLTANVDCLFAAVPLHVRNGCGKVSNKTREDANGVTQHHIEFVPKTWNAQ